MYLVATRHAADPCGAILKQFSRAFWGLSWTILDLSLAILGHSGVRALRSKKNKLRNGPEVAFVRWGRRKVQRLETTSDAKNNYENNVFVRMSSPICLFLHSGQPGKSDVNTVLIKKPVVLDHVSRRQQTKYTSRSSKFEVWLNFLGTASAIDTPKPWMMMAMAKKAEQGKTTKRRRSEGDSSPK